MEKLFIKCKDAMHICDKSQYNEITFLEKFKLKLHFIYCQACCIYTSQNAKLTALINKIKTTSLNSSEKEKLQHAFETELAKQKDKN